MRIKLTGIYVDDQDKALAFYTEKLGFTVKTDAPYSPTERWLSLVSPDHPDGTELLLGSFPNEHARALQRSLYEAGTPATAFSTEDCQAEYERLEARGVTFTMAPKQMPYGGTDAVLDDGCGNLICLHQD
jgi:catechol 2,3-dioxygenase-like lactoylglutathione lyase family enzyme